MRWGEGGIEAQWKNIQGLDAVLGHVLVWHLYVM